MKLLAWISGIIALLLMLCGFIVFVSNGKFLGVNHAVNYFHVANSFLLVSIALLLLNHKKED
ncbi:MAG: hypothetical protein GXO83_02130 [Chlorobi bacterium]|nr:hypothetical protein [Chlorobiota bacterium]